MVDIVQNTLDGLMTGSAYALLAIGFTLIFGVMRRLNLSFGPSIMFGAFVGTLLHLQIQSGAVVVAAATVAGAVLIGMYVERLSFWAIRKDAALASMISSYALWMQLQEIVTIFFPRRTYPFPSLVEPTQIALGPFTLRSEYLFMFGCAAALTLGVHAILYRTRFGLYLRAVSEDPAAARYMGINLGRVMFWGFALASAIGGAAGFLILSAQETVETMFGMWATFKGLIAMMLGGMGSIPGAIAGGLLLGVVETNVLWLFGPQPRDMTAYLLLFIVLIARPGGLFANKSMRDAVAAERRV
ncbi:MAG: branched-chain amino acid ABC transporter permease [Alphaproteobacteria bacterium]